ncbi:MAG: DUF4396 domain-containing protein [Pseudomonadales bacterium]|jgi:hypothetical protein|nr:DUF4396 domain-containing protein [Pseudomonadales bacterium]MDA0761571.1 DUF4396 domain-containing protein [Pseudomonadota bacterium]MDA0958772.1 DUF4396 domain-containing protein [Pseudomonadota bacterium]MDA1207422.1 DUF4396 domain-containing protein [Pseudomonadota bacterium]
MTETSSQTQPVPRLFELNWRCRHTWSKASYNTLWCLLGCSIGDMGTILFFQLSGIPWPVWAIMSLAIVNGLITSILLETVIMMRQMALREAFKTAIGMSLISMVSMELAMNLVDVAVTGGAKLTLSVLPLMWLAGFLTPLPYNYWRLKALGKACH